MLILTYFLAGVSFLMSFLYIIQPKAPLGFMVWFPKLVAGALSPLWAVMGIAGAVMGWVYKTPWAILMGSISTAMMTWYVWQCARPHTGFEKAFGKDWATRILSEQSARMSKRRWTWVLGMNASPEPIFERDITFWTVADSDRKLLCDLWRPADGKPSGLALIYFHGSAWYMLDKDYGTRPFFRHLVSQGLTVMDVAYRLCPEVDLFGMVGDVKRAIAWMKSNASQYGIDPEKIVLGGASAGGHLALLAGYAPHHPELTPDDVKNANLSVCGIFSYYGPTDLLAVYEHTNQQRIIDLPPVPIGAKGNYTKSIRDAGRLDILLGGHPKEAMHNYLLGSPISHVHSGCPPTLLIQGTQDLITPAKAASALYEKLVEMRVPVINVMFPWTNHGFDLLLPQISPPTQSALYDVDRFLALMVS